ncbi:MAG: ribosome maturation factor RimM [Bacilli bacterium]|nr:ribosome maturation factor RimM [Bacilli bacterium]
MEKLLLGYVISSFSLDGTMKVLSKTNMSEKRYVKGNVIYLADKEENIVKELTVSSFRHSGEIDFVKFEEITTKEEADSYKSYSLLVDKTDDLEAGYYYFSDLEKCNVVSNGKIVGKVVKVEEFPAQITLRVKSNQGKEFFVPFIKEFIKSVSLEKSEIDVVLWDGML